jgi:hypothetical protein
MRWRPAAPVLAGLSLVATWGCGPEPDLQSLKLISQLSGYYDDGPVLEGPEKGQNRLLPTVTFQLKNEGALPITYVDLTLAYWRVTDDGDALVQGIGATPLAPGATSESITVRSSVGYTSPHARAEFFTHSAFIDFKVKVFARRAGRNASLGELAVERRLLPATPRSGLRP